MKIATIKREPEDMVYTVEEVATIMRASKQYVYTLINANQIRQMLMRPIRQRLSRTFHASLSRHRLYLRQMHYSLVRLHRLHRIQNHTIRKPLLQNTQQRMYLLSLKLFWQQVSLEDTRQMEALSCMCLLTLWISLRCLRNLHARLK